MDTKIKDILVQAPRQQVAKHFETLSKTFRILARDIGTRTVRSNESLAYTNLVDRTAIELKRIAGFYPDCIDGVAWCARNVFELNLTIRHISREVENMNRWLGQLAGDERQIIQGFLALSEESNRPERQVLERRLDDINAICSKHNIKSSGPFNIRTIADEEQLSDEYVGLYKLFSKYVHPSSWLVNSSTDSIKSEEYLNIFVIHSQLHASDSYSRISEWLTAAVTPNP